MPHSLLDKDIQTNRLILAQWETPMLTHTQHWRTDVGTVSHSFLPQRSGDITHPHIYWLLIQFFHRSILNTRLILWLTSSLQYLITITVDSTHESEPAHSFNWFMSSTQVSFLKLFCSSKTKNTKVLTIFGHNNLFKVEIFHRWSYTMATDALLGD